MNFLSDVGLIQENVIVNSDNNIAVYLTGNLEFRTTSSVAVKSCDVE